MLSGWYIHFLPSLPSPLDDPRLPGALPAAANKHHLLVCSACSPPLPIRSINQSINHREPPVPQQVFCMIERRRRRKKRATYYVVVMPCTECPLGRPGAENNNPPIGPSFTWTSPIHPSVHPRSQPQEIFKIHRITKSYHSVERREA